MVKICLNMIVKNESKIITRLFDSLINIIDHWIISDTGSTDGTPEIIKEYFKKINMDGEIHNHVWKNFGHNRSLALKCAQQSQLEFDYILLLDADMKLVISPLFNKNALTHDVYTIKQGCSTMTYYNMRILKKKLNATCVCPTHEYYDIKGHYTSHPLDSMYIDDIGDGGSKADKYERDIRLLKEGIEEEPMNARYHFYLARSYECIGDHENAIIMYKKRIELKNWSEEIWYSYYRIAEIYNHQKNHDMAISNYLMAYEINPARVENICKLIELYRNKSMYKLAIFFIGIGEQTIKSHKLVESETLFHEIPPYKYTLEYEKSIVSYYVGMKEEGLRTCNNLLLNRTELNLPNNKYYSTMSNIKHYLSPLNKKNMSTFALNDISTISCKIIPDHINIFNPSIAIIRNKKYINLRCSNYDTKIINNKLSYSVYKNGILVEPSIDNPVSTVNYFCSLDDNYKLKTGSLIEHDDNFFKYHKSVNGIEDIRIFEYQNNAYFIGNCRQVSEQHHPRMVIGNISFDNFGHTQNMVVLNGYCDDICQKNWSPFIHNKKLLFLYSFCPLIILKPDITTGTCTEFKNIPQTKYYGEFRGGSQGIIINDKYYFAVHEVVHEQGRIYYHRIVEMDKEFNITNVTVPFYLENIGIEYISGMIYDRKEDELTISWASMDSKANVCTMKFNELNKLWSNK